MIICVTPEDAARTSRVTSEVEGGSMFHVLGEAQSAGSPLAFVASQTQVCILPTHFHAADQYQVILKGSGRIGGHPVSRGTIHYSDAYTPYGPVTPASEGLSYLTLRPRYTYAYHTLPECKDLLREKMREHRGSQKIVATDFDERRDAAEQVLWQRADGVAVVRIDGEPGQNICVQPAALGRFFLVMHGAVEVDGRTCPDGTCLWVDANEPPPAMLTHADGAVVMVLSFASQHQ